MCSRIQRQGKSAPSRGEEFALCCGKMNPQPALPESSPAYNWLARLRREKLKAAEAWRAPRLFLHHSTSWEEGPLDSICSAL